VSKVIALSFQDDASLIKFKNVIDVAIAFTAMTRVFEKGSKQKIAEKLESTLGLLAGVDGKDKFEKIHSEFCKWFVKNINTAQKVLKNKRVKKSHPASYGQAGKVFNVVLKVYVYYCHYPDYQASKKLIPLLHAAVDTLMMKYLKEEYQQENIKAETIEAVSKAEYVTLQKMVNMDIENEFENQIFPVHWDDIIWYRLNR
jgi:hypothetical protein